MSRGHRRAAVVAVVACTLAAPVDAQGHGPVYGLSTPTLGRGSWSLDVAVMGRLLEGSRTAMLRPMLGYGITEDLQLSVSVPVPLLRDPAAAGVRAFTRMPATPDVETMLGWRLQRRGVGVGARQETTVWVALDVPTDDRRAGLQPAPAAFGSIVTGYASRSVYVWLGGGYGRTLDTGPAGDRAGDVAMGSVVVGYRPPAFRADYPHPDWRAFVELVGEHVGRATADGTTRPDSGGHELHLAVTALGLYGSWGVSGGPAYPLVQALRGDRPEDRLRLALNASFWF